MIFDLPWLEHEQPGAGSEQRTAHREGASTVAAAGLGWQQGWPWWPGRGALALLVVAGSGCVVGAVPCERRSRSWQRCSCTSAAVDGMQWKRLASAVFPMSKLQLVA